MIRKIYFVLLLALFAGSLGLRAQSVAISGKVTSSEDKASLPGVSISVLETSTGAITDLDGNFNLTVKKGSTLRFSFIGYVPVQIVVGDQTTIDVELKAEFTTLDDVVVTALGIKREKKALGYAVQDVKGSEITQGGETNLVNSLSGKVAGAQIISSSGQVGASSTIKIRGNKSFNGMNSPLFVVDGTPIMNTTNDARSNSTRTDFGNSAMDIDPSSIESISILKGASAAALYGSRGSDGVILITTKKGAGAKKGFGVAFSSSASMDKVYILPNYQNSYGQGYNGDEYNWKTNYLATYPTYQAFQDGREFKWALDGTGRRMDYDESWGTRLDVGLLVDQMEGKQLPWVSRPNNIKDFYETGSTFSNSVDLTFNNEKTTGRFSLGNSKQKGTSPNTDQTKNNVSFNAGFKISDKFKIDMNLNLIQLLNDNLPQQGNSMRNPLVEFNSWFGRQVDMNYLKEHYNDIVTYKGSPMAYNWMLDYSTQHNNPYWLAYNNTMSRDRKRAFGNASFTYTIAEGIEVLGRIGTDYSNENRKYKFNQYTRDWDNEYKVATNGTFWEQYQILNETNADLMLQIKKNITPDISLFAVLGTNSRSSYDQYNTVYGTNLIIPNFFSTSNFEGQPSVSFTKYKRKTSSVYASANLGYKNYLYLDLTYRNDWSSTLPKENRSYNYPSVNLGFIFTEALKLTSDIFTYGKVRMGYAEVGTDTDPYQLAQVFSSGGTSFNGANLFTGTTTYPTANLKPQRTRSYEGGAELKFFKNRLGLDVTYYQATTYNQILPVSVSSTSGYSSWMKNAGKIENKGVELQIYGTPLKIKDFDWTINVNWSKNTNKVIELESGINQLQLNTLYYNSNLMAFPGKAWGTIYGTNFKKNAAGQALIGANGLPITTTAPEDLGSVNPDWIGGVRNTFTYKNFSLSALIDIRMGGDMVSMTKAVGQYGGITQNTVEGGIRENGMIVEGVYDAGVKVNAVDVSGQPNATRISTRTYFKATRPWGELAVVDGSFVKFREITFSYAIPKNEYFKKIGIQSASVSVYGRNLALLYKDKSNDVNIDPEVSTGGSISGVGLESYQLPPTRTFGVKLNLNF